MFGCRTNTLREFRDGSLALIFRLTHRFYIVGYALGDEGMLFRGELLTDSDDDDARRDAIAIAEHRWRSTLKTPPIPGTANPSSQRATIPTGNGSSRSGTEALPP